MKKLYRNESSQFGFFENEKERKKHEKDISLTIQVGNEKVDLYNFNVISKDDKIQFAYKYRIGEDGAKAVLYYFTNEIDGKFLEKFFNACREKKIVPIDIISQIKSAIAEKKSLENAKRIKENEEM